MLTRISAKIAVLILLSLAVTTKTLAQGGNQGTIEGTVEDQSGAVVAGAQITATHQSTGAAFTGTSKDDGFFEFPLLPVGIYDITVKKQGFAALAEKGVKLTIGAKLSLKLALKVSSTSETVVVTGEAPVVETTRTEVAARPR